jgi:hypothetical protein
MAQPKVQMRGIHSFENWDWAGLAREIAFRTWGVYASIDWIKARRGSWPKTALPKSSRLTIKSAQVITL